MILWLHERRRLSLSEKLGKDLKKIAPGTTLNIVLARAAMEAAQEYERAHLGVTVVSTRFVVDTIELQTVRSDMIDAMRFAIMSPRSAVQITYT